MNAIPGRAKRRAETAPAARDAQEANAFLSRFGELQRQTMLHEAALAESIARAKDATAAIVADLTKEADAIARGLQLWAEANRHDLTEGGKTKTVKLGAGTIAWRTAPPAVKLSKPADVLNYLMANRMEEFLRRKVEIDKAAMLAMAEAAAQVPGVTIASSGEEFVIEPAGAQEIGA